MNADSWIMHALPRASTGGNEERGLVRLQVGLGSGAECDYCHGAIGPNEVEFEVETFVLCGLRTLHFHRACHHQWEARQL